ncbi:hypothetical protein [Limimaricola cinnabarinus]|uniref:hypothetical protein n=1 Tax=Limimaricola cinnabarinus TaxID=1125964 RepID=UPI002490F7D2|nr:hypothetical protein [Limimaricola cinnabarinus]
MSKRKQHAPAFKAKVALETLKGEQTAGEPVRGTSHADPSVEAGFAQGRFRIFERGGKKTPEVDEAQVKELHAKIGELAVANDFLSRKLKPGGRDVRRGMIERDHPTLSVGRQCRLLSLSRSSFYYRPAGKTELNLDLMRLIDEQFLETPFYGVRQMARHLRSSRDRGPSGAA